MASSTRPPNVAPTQAGAPTGGPQGRKYLYIMYWPVSRIPGISDGFIPATPLEAGQRFQGFAHCNLVIDKSGIYDPRVYAPQPGQPYQGDLYDLMGTGKNPNATNPPLRLGKRPFTGPPRKDNTFAFLGWTDESDQMIDASAAGIIQDFNKQGFHLIFRSCQEFVNQLYMKIRDQYEVDRDVLVNRLRN